MIKGILSYSAIMGFTLIWIVAWLCICWLVGAFFNLPMQTTAVIGATLGPFGLVMILILGIFSKNNESFTQQRYEQNKTILSPRDPFA